MATVCPISMANVNDKVLPRKVNIFQLDGIPKTYSAPIGSNKHPARFMSLHFPIEQYIGLFKHGSF